MPAVSSLRDTRRLAGTSSTGLKLPTSRFANIQFRKEVFLDQITTITPEEASQQQMKPRMTFLERVANLLVLADSCDRSAAAVI